MTTSPWAPYLRVLETVPFVERARVEPAPARRASNGLVPDGLLVLRAAGRDHQLLIEEKRARQMTRPVLEALIASVGGRAGRDWILFADSIGPEQAEALVRAGISFVDRAGNHQLRLGRGLHAYVVGQRKPRERRRGRALGVPGYRMLFAVLAKPALLESPEVRRLALEAGVGKSTAADALRRMLDEGLLARSRTRLLLVRPEKLLDRWLHGYAELVRPKLDYGRFEFEGTRFRALIRSIEKREGSPPRTTPRWAWGGETAGKLLTQHIESPRFLVHIEGSPEFFVRRLRLAPSATGRLDLLGVPGPLAFGPWGQEHAHPLLVYSELMTTGGERAREAAHIIRNRHLDWLAASR